MHKLILDDFIEDIDYALIGIHCSIEDYRLAYLLNQYLNLGLKRKSKDIEYIDDHSFSIFEWEDEKRLMMWHLVSNSSRIEVVTESQGISLFNDQERLIKTNHLIPEYNRVNYVLKIGDNPDQKIRKKALNIIKSIPHIITAYDIDPDNLKTTDHLIFN